MVGRTAIVAHIGAAERQGEEAPVAAALQKLGYNLKVGTAATLTTLVAGDMLGGGGCCLCALCLQLAVPSSCACQHALCWWGEAVAKHCA